MTYLPSTPRRARRLGGALAGVLALGLVPLAGPASAAHIATSPRPITVSGCPGETGGAMPVTGVPEDGFGDVAASNPHEYAIDCLSWYGITGGTSADRYTPAGSVTRAQMTTFIANVIDYIDPFVAASDSTAAQGLPPATGTEPYTDVSSTNTHYDSIRRLTAAGIVQGIDADSFAPSQPVTRAQMATFINNAQDFVDGTGDGFPATTNDYFTDDEGSTHEDNINAITAAGIAQGIGGDLYAPNAPVRRDQMATFLTRLLDFNAAGSSPDTAPPPGIVVAGPSELKQGDPVNLTITADRGGVIESATVRGCGIDAASEEANPEQEPPKSVLKALPTIGEQQPTGDCDLTIVTTFERGAPHPLGSRTETDVLTITVVV